MSETVFDPNDPTTPGFLEKIETHDSYFILRFKGELDMASIAKNRPKMDKVIKQFDLFSKHVLCDFGHATYGDTATVAAMITRLAELNKRQNKLVFFNVPTSLESIIEISKVGQLFAICKTEQEALDTLQQ